MKSSKIMPNISFENLHKIVLHLFSQYCHQLSNRLSNHLQRLLKTPNYFLNLQKSFEKYPKNIILKNLFKIVLHVFSQSCHQLSNRLAPCTVWPDIGAAPCVKMLRNALSPTARPAWPPVMPPTSEVAFLKQPAFKMHICIGGLSSCPFSADLAEKRESSKGLKLTAESAQRAESADRRCARQSVSQLARNSPASSATLSFELHKNPKSKYFLRFLKLKWNKGRDFKELKVGCSAQL